MSHVTNVMIVGHISDDEFIPVVEQLKKFAGDGREFVQIDKYSVGGNKNLEADILIGAFNYMDYQLFCETIAGLKNVMSEYNFENVQIMWKGQHDEHWHLQYAQALSVKDFK